jgi:hypothetical protein
MQLFRKYDGFEKIFRLLKYFPPMTYDLLMYSVGIITNTLIANTNMYLLSKMGWGRKKWALNGFTIGGDVRGGGGEFENQYPKKGLDIQYEGTN